MEKAKASIKMDLERNSLMRSCWIWAGINSRDCIERLEWWMRCGREAKGRWEMGRADVVQ